MNPVTISLPSNAGRSSRVRYKNILFATDLTASSASARAYALLLARMFGSRLFVLYVQTGPGLSSRYQTAWASGAHKGEASSIVEVEEFFRASQIPFKLLIEPGEVPDVLNRVVEKNAIDLVILGTHGRKGFSHALLGSMAENVSRSSACPVITVGPRARTGFESSLRTIVYATDFSEESRLALPHAISLAQEFHSELVILHVAPEHMVCDRMDVEAYLTNRLKSLAPQSRFPWCTLKHMVKFGLPERQIVKAAEDERASLIVLGLHTSVQFTSHFPERLSYGIVCDSPCPVMSVLPSIRDMKLASIPAEFLLLAPQMN